MKCNYFSESRMAALLEKESNMHEREQMLIRLRGIEANPFYAKLLGEMLDETRSARATVESEIRDMEERRQVKA